MINAKNLYLISNLIFEHLIYHLVRSDSDFNFQIPNVVLENLFTDVAIGILTRLEITSFYQCQYESALIRNALKFNLPLPYDIPRRTISANDVSFVLFTR